MRKLWIGTVLAALAAAGVVIPATPAAAAESCSAVGPSLTTCDITVSGPTVVDRRASEYEVLVYRGGRLIGYAAGAGYGHVLSAPFTLPTVAGDQVVAVAKGVGVVTVTG